MNGSTRTEPADLWRRQVVENLASGDEACRRAAWFLADHDVEIGFGKQSTGARWTMSGQIALNPLYFSLETPPADPRLLATVLHEAVHLQQGPALALSVAGEVAAWRAEFHARAAMNAPIRDRHWEAVARTPDPPTNEDLRAARRTILQRTGYRYLIWLLPLRPGLLGLLARLFWRAPVLTTERSDERQRDEQEKNA